MCTAVELQPYTTMSDTKYFCLAAFVQVSLGQLVPLWSSSFTWEPPELVKRSFLTGRLRSPTCVPVKSHVVDSCPLTKLADGLSKLHSADDQGAHCNDVTKIQDFSWLFRTRGNPGWWRCYTADQLRRPTEDAQDNTKTTMGQMTFLSPNHQCQSSEDNTKH